MKPAILLVLGAVALASCSSDAATPTTSSSTAAVTTTNAPASSSLPQSTTSATVAPPTSAPTTTSPQPELAPAIDLVQQSAEATGTLSITVDGSKRPAIAWPDVPNAERYAVVVVGADGAVQWSWQGAATSVTVGGGAVDRPGLGAEIAPPGWIQVFGLSTEDGIVAASDATWFE